MEPKNISTNKKNKNFPNSVPSQLDFRETALKPISISTTSAENKSRDITVEVEIF